jgi:hypothetical protein
MILLLGIAVLGFLAFELYVTEAGPGTIPDYARKAGFSGADLTIAVAIAYAESSGDPNALGDNGNSYGLWQINLPAHPEYAGADLYDPQTNANAAFAIYQQAGESFSPWTTFKTGAYEQYLGGNPPALSSSDRNSFGAAIGGW